MLTIKDSHCIFPFCQNPELSDILARFAVLIRVRVKLHRVWRNPQQQRPQEPIRIVTHQITLDIFCVTGRQPPIDVPHYVFVDSLRE